MVSCLTSQESLSLLRPFRRLDSNGDLQWDKINKLEKGQVYKQVRSWTVEDKVFMVVSSVLEPN